MVNIDKCLVSFDLIGTLTDKEFIDLFWLEGIPRRYCEKYGLSLSEAKKKVFKEYNKVGDKRIEWYLIDYWLKRFKLNVDYMEIFEEYSDKINIYPEVPIVLEKLRDLGVRVIVSSRSSTEFIQYMLKGYKEYFYRFFSSVSNYSKVLKDIEFYSLVCRDLGVTPSNMVHVGDSYLEDYLNPRKAGIKSFLLIRGKARGKGGSVITDLVDFLERLRKLNTNPFTCTH